LKKTRLTAAGALVSLIIFSAICSTACTGVQSAGTPPFVPPEYYDCVEIDPADLYGNYIYYTAHGDYATAVSQYTNRYFVIKEMEVNERMYSTIQNGFIWADYIECHLVDVNSLRQYKPGDLIDIVGLNKGPSSQDIMSIRFNACIIMPAGSLALPAEKGTGMVSFGY